jgi:hypothetical protein
MTQAPEDTDYCGMPDASLAADDCGYSDYVVRIHGVAHAQKKTKRNNGE